MEKERDLIVLPALALGEIDHLMRAGWETPRCSGSWRI
jgi:hypothetical protein